MFYYQYQINKYLEGTLEELRRYHQDYPPQETKELAKTCCLNFLVQQRDHYLELARNWDTLYKMTNGY